MEHLNSTWDQAMRGKRRSTMTGWSAFRTLRRVMRERRGVTVIEFAFVVGPLFALIIAILQTSLTFFAQQNLETAAEKSVRLLMTGNAQQNNLSQAQFKQRVCDNLPDFMNKNCANVLVDVQVATNGFSSANTAAPTITYDSGGNPNNAWAYQLGQPGQITVAKVMYVWDVSKGPLGFDLSTMSRGKRLLVSTSVFKTELY